MKAWIEDQRLWWRFWSIQAGWNPESQQSLGWMVILLPWLRRRTWPAERKRSWLQSRDGFSNTNPYMAPCLLGLMSRLHEEEDPAVGEAMILSLSRSLGSVGDQLFWRGIRPALAMILVITTGLGLWISAVVGWTLFMAGQAALRHLCWKRGRQGAETLLQWLSHPAFHGAAAACRGLGLIFLGTLWILMIESAVAMGSFLEGIILPVVGLALGGLSLRRRWPMERVILVGAVLSWICLRLLGDGIRG